MKKLFKIVLVCSLSLMCFSCYYDEFLEEAEVVIEDVSFANDIQPIFTQNCISCHNASRDPDLRVGNAFAAIVPDYVTPGNADNSELFNKLPGNNHPNDVGFTLSSEEIALVKAWIDRGAENN